MFGVLTMVDVVLSGVADVPYYPIGIQMYGGLRQGAEFPCNHKHSFRDKPRTSYGSTKRTRFDRRAKPEQVSVRVLGSETERTDLLKVG